MSHSQSGLSKVTLAFFGAAVLAIGAWAIWLMHESTPFHEVKIKTGVMEVTVTGKVETPTEVTDPKEKSSEVSGKAEKQTDAPPAVIKQELKVFGPFISDLTDQHFIDTMTFVNDCLPAKVQDVHVFFHQQPKRQGEYAIIVMCMPGGNSTQSVRFVTRKKLGVNLNLDLEIQKLRQRPDVIVPILAYWGGQDGIYWLEREDSNVYGL